MGLTNEALADIVSERLTELDVDLLQNHGHGEQSLSILGMEHLSRAITLIRANQDGVFARNLMMIGANELLKAIKALDETLKKEPHLALVQ